MNYTKLSAFRYRVENQNGLNNAIYDFFDVAQNLRGYTKAELRSYLKNWPTKYPCNVTIIDNIDHFQVIQVDIEEIPDTSAVDALVAAYDKYIALLGEELDAVVPLAAAHGWKSSRYEKGKALREEIESLKKYL